MKASDYIVGGNGKGITLDKRARKMIASFLAENGGGKKVAKDTGLHENTISKLKNGGTCSPETWETLFKHMNLQPAA